MRTNNKWFLLFLSVLFSFENISAQISLGTEFKVNTTTVNQQRNPAIGADSMGNAFVVWESFQNSSSQYRIYGQRYDNTATPLGAEFVVNQSGLESMRFPDVAMSPAGLAVVVSQMRVAGPGTFNVRFRRFNNLGNPIGSEKLASTTIAGNHLRPKVAIDAIGNFVVTWMSEDLDSYGIYARRFDSTSAGFGGEFLVNTTTTAYQGYPDVASSPSGEFVITWQSNGTDGSGNGVYAQRYSATGAAVGSEFLVNTTTVGNQQEPSVAMKANGDFGIVWSSYNQDGSEYGVYAKLYDNTGAVLKAEFLVNDSTNGNQLHAEIETSPSGRYFITWTSDELDAANGGVSVTALGVDGGKSFPDMQVNNRVNDYQQFSALASANDSNLIVVFQDGLQNSTTTHDGDGYGVYARTLLLNNIPLPVSLLSFSVERQLKSDLVKWTTANETNNSHFNVQRSANALDFETLGNVNSKAISGNPTAELNYTFTDKKPLIGNNYYRLEQVDIDGQKNYSNVINIKWTEQGFVTIYPNPTQDILNVDFSLVDQNRCELKLIDLNGKVVKSIFTNAQKGTNHIEVSLNE